MINDIWLLINQNWLGVFLGIASLCYAIYEAKRKRGPRLCYQYTGDRLIRTDIKLIPDGLEVKFAGEVVNNLSITKIIVWNLGPSPIKRSDIPAEDRIKFRFPKNTKILRAEITRSTRDIIDAKIDYQPGTACRITYDFNFLDSNDGSLITIWHDASVTMAKASGTIIGQTKGPQSFGRYYPSAPLFPALGKRKSLAFSDSIRLNMVRLASNRKAFSWINIFYGVLMLVVFVLFRVDSVRSTLAVVGISTPNFGDLGLVITLLVAPILIIGGSVQLYALRRKFPKSLDPDEVVSEKSETDIVTA